MTPSYEDGVKCLQASSPDEIALVEIAESLGLQLISRNQVEIVLQTPLGARESYEILANFPFSSTTKRMGIVLKNKETQQITFHLKGADVVMKTKVDYV